MLWTFQQPTPRGPSDRRMTERIHLSRAIAAEPEERWVLEALRSGWVAPLGPMVDEFERQIADLCGAAHATALSSGTAALHLGLLGVGVQPGDAVVVPSLTFVATANAVLTAGARPVFVDADVDGNIDPVLVAEAIDTLRAEGETVAAVVPVDLMGRCVDYGRLLPLLAERGIPVVEDAAEALGAQRDGIRAGSVGECAALSFNGNKILTTSGGGMLLSDDPDLITRARYLATQARQPVPWYEHTEQGYNYRLSNILAALGLGQLERFPAMLTRRREIREAYAAQLASRAGVSLLGRDVDGGDAGDNCWLTCVRFDREQTGVSADQVVEALNGAGIEARHLWKPLHLQPMFADSRVFGTEVSERLFAETVTLPSGAELSPEQVDRVIAAVLDLLPAETSA